MTNFFGKNLKGIYIVYIIISNLEFIGIYIVCIIHRCIGINPITSILYEKRFEKMYNLRDVRNCMEKNELKLWSDEMLDEMTKNGILPSARGEVSGYKRFQSMLNHGKKDLGAFNRVMFDPVALNTWKRRVIGSKDLMLRIGAFFTFQELFKYQRVCVSFQQWIGELKCPILVTTDMLRLFHRITHLYFLSTSHAGEFDLFNRHLASLNYDKSLQYKWKNIIYTKLNLCFVTKLPLICEEDVKLLEKNVLAHVKHVTYEYQRLRTRGRGEGHSNDRINLLHRLYCPQAVALIVQDSVSTSSQTKNRDVGSWYGRYQSHVMMATTVKVVRLQGVCIGKKSVLLFGDNIEYLELISVERYYPDEEYMEKLGKDMEKRLSLLKYLSLNTLADGYIFGYVRVGRRGTSDVSISFNIIIQLLNKYKQLKELEISTLTSIYAADLLYIMKCCNDANFNVRLSSVRVTLWQSIDFTFIKSFLDEIENFKNKQTKIYMAGYFSMKIRVDAKTWKIIPCGCIQDISSLILRIHEDNKYTFTIGAKKTRGAPDPVYRYDVNIIHSCKANKLYFWILLSGKDIFEKEIYKKMLKETEGLWEEGFEIY